MAKAIEKAMQEVLRKSPQASEFLPCGHTRAQAAWLGCTEDECRPHDVKISQQFQSQPKGR